MKYFNLEKRKNSNIYEGMGRDGVWRSVKFDYHKARDEVRKGTALNIAQNLGFKTLMEMKGFFNQL